MSALSYYSNTAPKIAGITMFLPWCSWVNALLFQYQAGIITRRDVTIRTNDLVTIDLSPMVNDCWGDCARSYIVESEVLSHLTEVPPWIMEKILRENFTLL